MTDVVRAQAGTGIWPLCIGSNRINAIITKLTKMNMLTPNKLRWRIRRKLGRLYSKGHIRKILGRFSYSPKRSVTTYAAAATKRTVKVWQADAKSIILRAKKDGFTTVIQDESIFVRIGTNGRKLWSRVGDPVVVKRSGRKDKTIVYGSIADDGTRLMRQYEKFDGPTFVKYLEEARRKWGKVLMIMDNARQHIGKHVTEYLEQHGDDVMILYLPTARPELSAIEALWKQAKYRLVTSAHYETLEDLKHAVSEYFRTCSIKLDIYKYLERSV